jgi:hypothetical protein
MARKWRKNMDQTSGEVREFINFYNARGEKISLGFPKAAHSNKKVYFEKDGEVEYISRKKADGLLKDGQKQIASKFKKSIGDSDSLNLTNNIKSIGTSYAKGSKGKGFCISCGTSKSYNVKYPLCNSCYKSYDDPYDEYFDHCHKCGEVKRKGRLSIEEFQLCSACWRDEN